MNRKLSVVRSPSLDALLQLSPPSPILNACRADPEIRSGYIPILLDDNLYIERHELDQLEESLVDIGPSFPNSETACIGTFGPVNRRSDFQSLLAETDSPIQDDSLFLRRFSQSTSSESTAKPYAIYVQPPCSDNTVTRESQTFSASSYSVILDENQAQIISPSTSLNLPSPSFALPSRSDSLYSLSSLPVSSPSKSPLMKTPQSLTRHAHIRRTPSQEILSRPQQPPWLQDMIIELLIDQEGFRSVSPRLKFVGYSSSTKLYDTQGRSVTGGVATFMPLSRQTFCFHSGPFEAPPVLRRIMVIGGSTRDYIARQAALCIKAFGIYSVQGIETCSLPASHPDTPYPKPHSDLRWKFDYMVDERRKGSVSQMEGEKTLTPLTFSCSPTLLHPLQGKKIKLMHIVKKSVAAKLVAEKVEPPGLRSPIILNPAPATPDPVNLAKGRWNLHRRAQSHMAPGNDVENMTNVEITPSVKTSMRRRRASSAGERTRRVCREGNTLQIANHILPPNQLTKMMSNLSADMDEWQLGMPKVLAPSSRKLNQA